MAEQKKALPEYPFFVDRPTPVRDFVLGEKRVLGPKGKGLRKGPLAKEGSEEAGNGGEAQKAKKKGGFINGFRPLDRLREFREGKEEEEG